MVDARDRGTLTNRRTMSMNDVQMEIFRRGLRKAATGPIRGYVSRREGAPVEVFEYNGRYGKGLAVAQPRMDTTRYCWLEYYVGESEDSGEFESFELTLAECFMISDLLAAGRAIDECWVSEVGVYGWSVNGNACVFYMRSKEKLLKVLTAVVQETAPLNTEYLELLGRIRNAI